MRKIYSITIFMAIALLCGCRSSQGQEGTQETNSTVVASSEIPYTVAEGYFVNNTLKEKVNTSITAQDEFDKYFGMAATMSSLPTKIDFSNEYVISITKSTTKYNTTLTPVNLKRTPDGNLSFTYRIEKGEKRSYAIRPCLLIVVPKTVTGKIRYHGIS